MVRRGPALHRLSRRGMGRAEIRRPRAVREARAGRIQAGLSWITILRKREAFRAAFDNFDAQAMARYWTKKVASLLKDEGIVRASRQDRSRDLKCASFPRARDRGQASASSCGASSTARRSRTPTRKWPTFRPRLRRARHLAKALKSHGFRFTGPTTHARLHAGRRHGQRPSDRLLPPCRMRRSLAARFSL